MSIFEKARELGDLVLASEQGKNLSDAREIFENNEDAQKKFNEYANYHSDVQKAMKTGELTKEEIDISTKKLGEMAIEIKREPIIAALVFAENEFNYFVNQVMGVLKSTITGEDTSAQGCSGCSSASNCDGGCN